MPVVCSDIPVLREQVGRLGAEVQHFDPGSAESLAGALRELEAGLARRTQAARDQVARLARRSWRDVAGDYWRVFDEVARGAGGSGVMRYPVAVPDLAGNEERYVVEAIRSSWISSTGRFLDRFEQEFAAACGARHALAVSNGTVALHLALLGLGAGPGDEVLVPSLTYIATANAVRYVGAEPVFVDVDPGTWCIDPGRLAAGLTPHTRGIVAVDLYGHPADMDAINAFAAKHGLWVVEDAAEAHFARYRGRPVGSLARISTFSFYGNKILTSGEGGAVTLDDDELAARLKMIRGQGMRARSATLSRSPGTTSGSPTWRRRCCAHSSSAPTRSSPGGGGCSVGIANTLTAFRGSASSRCRRLSSPRRGSSASPSTGRCSAGHATTSPRCSPGTASTPVRSSCRCTRCRRSATARP